MRQVLLHGLGYVRWTQWLGVLVLWISLWAMLAAFAFVNFQQQGLGVIETLSLVAERLPWLPSLEGFGRTDESGVFYVDDSDVRGLLVRYWASGAAVLYIVSLLLRRILPERPPLSLRGRLAVLAGLGALTWVAFMAIYATSGETFHGSTLSWMFTFAAMVAIVTVASAVAVAIATLLEWVSLQVEIAPDLAKTAAERNAA